MASVDEEIRLRNAYLVAENRILRQQSSGRGPLMDGDRRTLAALGQKLGRQALEEIATVAKADTLLAWHHQCHCLRAAESTRQPRHRPLPHHRQRRHERRETRVSDHDDLSRGPDDLLWR